MLQYILDINPITYPCWVFSISMNKKHIGYHVDLKGELTDKIYQGDKTITQEQQKEFERQKLQTKVNDEKFVKYLCYSKLNEKLEKLPLICQLIFFFFVRNLHYDGSVRYRNYVNITTKDVAKKFALSGRVAQLKLKKLMVKKIIKRYNRSFFINPEIAHRGCVSKELLSIFE